MRTAGASLNEGREVSAFYCKDSCAGTDRDELKIVNLQYDVGAGQDTDEIVTVDYRQQPFF